MEDLRIAVMEGDGIGPDVERATMAVLDAAARHVEICITFEHLPVGLSAVATHSSTLPQVTLDALGHCHGWILGPVTHHIYDYADPRYVNPSGFLRKKFNLFANIRPCRSYPGVDCLYHDEILSGKLLFEWLASRFDQPRLLDAAHHVETAIEDTFLNGGRLTPDLGGTARTTDMVEDILASLERC